MKKTKLEGLRNFQESSSLTVCVPLGKKSSRSTSPCSKLKTEKALESKEDLKGSRYAGTYCEHPLPQPNSPLSSLSSCHDC